MQKNSLVPPPMGWNSWYCFSESVCDSKIREVARAIVDRGLDRFGWKFINIDDCWQGERGGKYHALQGNEKFPDMADLIRYVHSLGLKIGLYSTPWISSYAGFRGSSDDGYESRFELSPEKRRQPSQIYGRFPEAGEIGFYRVGANWRFSSDVIQWSEWGVDFIKMDWKPLDVPTTRRIREELDRSGRRILFSLSNFASIKIGDELLEKADLCRISEDIRDCWESICENGFRRGREWSQLLRPGHYLDPDMLQIGDLGIPNSKNTSYRKSRLTGEEQRSQFNLWALLSAPLLLSCDVAGMDDATFALLTNREVIAVDQDPLCAVPQFADFADHVVTVHKKLSGGHTAFGVFNMADRPQEIQLPLESSAIDLWSGHPVPAGTCFFELEPHGSVMLRF